jgi:hypothetical protein
MEKASRRFWVNHEKNSFQGILLGKWFEY